MAEAPRLRYTKAAVMGKEIQDHASIPFDTSNMPLGGLRSLR